MSVLPCHFLVKSALKRLLEHLLNLSGEERKVLIEPDLKEIAIRVSEEVVAAAVIAGLGFRRTLGVTIRYYRRRLERSRVQTNPAAADQLQLVLLLIRVLSTASAVIQGFGLETLGFTGLEFVFLFRLTHNQLKNKEPGYVNIQHSGEDLSAGDHQDEIEMFVGCGSRLIGLSKNLDVVQTMDKTWRKWNQAMIESGIITHDPTRRITLCFNTRRATRKPSPVPSFGMKVKTKRNKEFFPDEEPRYDEDYISPDEEECLLMQKALIRLAVKEK
ncbi:hypothetical protein E3N88_38255 [Mikania micrantha]|uniref:Uncharacterized protein n=1 Tax=Mikania micrantha TaxID=192012 RepID=A0A5N6LTH5_9ASTR|nr:hypothetical protein E3N88_38255 [Mikania micrantha]